MKDKICKNCIYWGRYRENCCDANQNTDSPNGFYIHATADDDSGLDADLVTGPNFGCTKFEEK